MKSLTKNIRNALILSLIVILTIFLITIYKNGINSIKFDLNYNYILILIAVVIFLWVIETLRLKIILNTFDYQIPFLSLIYIHLISLFFSAITPFGLGGFAMKVYLISKRKSYDVGGVSALIAIIYVINIIFTIIISIFSIIFLKRSDLMEMFYGRLISSIVIFILILSLLVFFLIINHETIRNISIKILNLFKKLSEEKKEKILNTINKNYERYKNTILSMGKLKWKLIFLFLLTILYWVTLLSISPILIASLNIKTSFFNASILQFIYHFFVGWAFTPGGSGISEAIYSSLFLNLVGLSNLTVLTFLFKFFTYYIYILIGGILSVNEVKKIGDINKIYDQ